jgi:hypothetical protein
MMVPVILIAIGFAFTKMQFDSDSVPKILRPDMYPAKQRLLVNKNLVWPPKDDGDFADDEDDSSGNILPSQLI